MNRRTKNNTGDMNDEVEELLRAAQDAALLKLTVNSHTVHASSSDLNPDLEQRFRNLKTGSKTEANPHPVAKKIAGLESKTVKEDVEDDDDLLTRFAALKASIPKPHTSMSSSLGENVAGGNSVGVDGVEDDEEDEVEKVIRWAMDAARLDPSPPSDDDDDDSEMGEEDADTASVNQKGQPKQ
ncbi:hypothetical protein RND81_09G183900 [Saponaria officinalis]|uniref:Uncharacterized protein n=1 Tax=Saponaria officinalis TaxID=3572 RepID=A0AAW1IMF8_SAPOF